jgi:hypothetical protein
MTWKDKLELGLKEDAPFRKDNLPATEIAGPELPAAPGRSPEIPAARENPTAAPTQLGTRPAPTKPYRIVPVRSGPPKDKV